MQPQPAIFLWADGHNQGTGHLQRIRRLVAALAESKSPPTMRRICNKYFLQNSRPVFLRNALLYQLRRQLASGGTGRTVGNVLLIADLRHPDSRLPAMLPRCLRLLLLDYFPPLVAATQTDDKTHHLARDNAWRIIVRALPHPDWLSMNGKTGQQGLAGEPPAGASSEAIFLARDYQGVNWVVLENPDYFLPNPYGCGQSHPSAGIPRRHPMVLLYLGGLDGDNLLKVVQRLRLPAPGSSTAVIQLVLAARTAKDGVVQEKVAVHFAGLAYEILPRTNEAQFAQMLAQCDTVATYYGLTALEAMAAGKPLLLLPISRYHARLARHLRATQRGVNTGWSISALTANPSHVATGADPSAAAPAVTGILPSATGGHAWRDLIQFIFCYRAHPLG